MIGPVTVATPVAALNHQTVREGERGEKKKNNGRLITDESHNFFF